MKFDAGTARRIHAWLAMNPGNRPFVQDAFPNLSSDERQFLVSGATPEERDEAFGGCEE